MKVKVSWKDINNGTPNDANNCAVACALMRKFKTTNVAVFYDRLYCDNDRDEGELVLKVGLECYDKNHIDKTDLEDYFPLIPPIITAFFNSLEFTTQCDATTIGKSGPE